MFFALRGMRTLSARLERHQRNALEVARWLQTRPEVSRVLYPALPEDPGHALWKRDFLGACGLFGVVLQPAPKEAVYAMIDALDLFGIGASWGGFESLIQPMYPERIRTATRWDAEGPGIRLHIGLEDPQDLIADLAQGLDKLHVVINRRLQADALFCVDKDAGRGWPKSGLRVWKTRNDSVLPEMACFGGVSAIALVSG